MTGTRRTFFSAENDLKRAINRKIRLILRYFALFLAQKKCAEFAHAPYQFKLAQSNHKKPQTPRRTFFPDKNGLKMAKNDQKPSKYALF